MSKQKGDKLTIKGFESIWLNDTTDYDDLDVGGTVKSCRVSYTLQEGPAKGTKFWIVIPDELIIKREAR